MPIDDSARGREYPPQTYEVSREKVREFAEAIGDANPVYVDRDAAATHGHADIAAPPTFVMIPVMNGFDMLMDDLGIEFARVVHVSQRFAYERAVVAGDHLVATTRLDGHRPMGANDLLTIRTVVRDRDGGDVCTSTATLLIRPEAADV
jgi:acyl dehydratase